MLLKHPGAPGLRELLKTQDVKMDLNLHVVIHALNSASKVSIIKASEKGVNATSQNYFESSP